MNKPMETWAAENINLSYLKLASNSDSFLIRKMIAALVMEIDKKIAFGHQQMLAGYEASSQYTAHSLKGLFGTLGVEELSEQFKTIEHALTANSDCASLLPLYVHCQKRWEGIRIQVNALKDALL